MNDDNKYNQALKKAMKLCASRELCRSEIESRLGKWGISEADMRKIINTLEQKKYLDEVRYSIAYTRDRFRHNKWGKIKISAMLRMKGLNEDTIRLALDSIDKNEYISTLRKIIDSHRKNVRAGTAFEMRGKLARFAASKGFESELVYEVLGDE